jgi:lysophospholipid acyltransferase (LPLAT)-like uncharacterized protein
VLKQTFKKLLQQPTVRKHLTQMGAYYLRAVVRSCSVIYSPPKLSSLAQRYLPCIITTWHGQSYLLAFSIQVPGQVRVLVSGSPDGQIFGQLIEPLGLNVVVGSGAGLSPGDMIRKRGLAAFEEMLRLLRGNCTVALTADVPKTERVAGLGIVKLARHSRRPIVPVGIMTTHRYRLGNWDKTIINYPFGRLAIVVGEPIFVEDTDDAKILEERRLQVATALDFVNAEAIRLAEEA